LDERVEPDADAAVGVGPRATTRAQDMLKTTLPERKTGMGRSNLPRHRSRIHQTGRGEVD
jgi:hypothetical protein